MTPPSVFSYLDFFHDYFSSALLLPFVALVIVSIAGLFLAFRFAPSSLSRSKLLLGMMLLSFSFWMFVISSFALCITLVQDYLISPSSTILFVTRLALLITISAGPLSFFMLRRRAASKISENLALIGSESFISEVVAKSGDYRRVHRIFSEILSRVGLDRSVDLYLIDHESRLPVSIAFDFDGRRVVCIRKSVLGSLDDDELETVLAHELAHIKNRDSIQKTLATTIKMALLFDPVVLLIEAAFYREREFIADEFAGLRTGKPASLASALLKIHDMLAPVYAVGSMSFSSLSVSHSPRNLWSKQPAIELRIRRLLALAKIV